MSHPFLLKDEIALITGGGSGIGKAIANAYVQAGAKVIITGRNSEKLEHTRQELGEQVYCYTHDITDYTHNDIFIDKLEEEVGPITILVNNAGNHLKKPSEDTSEDELTSLLNTHLVGAHSLTRQVGRRMKLRGKGNILFIASMASLFGIPGVIAYSAAKSAILGMVRTLAVEWSPHGIRVNAIAPGWIKTNMSEKALNSDPGRKQKILSRTPMNRLGEITEVGYAAQFLASDAAGFINGVCLPVDGGVSVGF